MKNTIPGSAAIIVAGLFLASAPVFAGTISYTCDTSISTAICDSMNSTVAGIYSSTFTNANANIWVEFANNGLGGSLQYRNVVTYKSYVDALTAHETSANDVTAVASLGGDTTNPVVAGNGVALSSTVDQVLGLTDGRGTNAASGSCDPFSNSCLTLGNPCVLGVDAGCYNGIISISNQGDIYFRGSGAQSAGTYDFFTVLEHETDEILGTPSCLRTSSGVGVVSGGCTVGGSTGVGAPDLFRYKGAGSRSYLADANNNTAAYFSVNGGTTSIAGYNNKPNGADYGDWDAGAPTNRVQNAFGTPGTNGVDITNDGGSEVVVLDVIGYDLTAPEPDTITMLGTGLALLIAGLVYRRRRRRG